MIKTLLVGPIFSRSGYGEHARFITDALLSQGDFDIHLHPIHWGVSSWLNNNQEKTKLYEELCVKKEINEEQPEEKKKYDLIIQVTIPSEWDLYSQMFKGDCCIGITAGAETDTVPPHWMMSADRVDHIIFTSNHARNGFKNTTLSLKAENSDDVINRKGLSVSSDVVGYPVKELNPKDLSESLSLTTDYNFLTITQLAPRKNSELLIHSFIKEFYNENVGLVLKMHHGNNSNYDRHMLRNGFMKSFHDPNRKCKIYWIHGSMTESELHGLYNHPQIDSYITTTHGEGFGLPLFESSYYGLPVCAPNWSGHLDFLKVPKGKKHEVMFEKIKGEVREVHESCYMENIIMPGMKWCHPTEKDTRKSMRAMVTARVPKKRIAERLKKHLREEFSEDNQFKKIGDICRGIFERKTAWKRSQEDIKVF